MEVQQVYELVNSATSEVLGDSAILNEDLTNVVDLGDAIFNANAFDAYVRTLVNRIGKVKFVNRSYSGGAPSVMYDAWEYGSVEQKIAAYLPDAVENESWELIDGASYDPNVFHAPRVEAKFFNKMTTFELDSSITERQVKQSFTSAEQLNAFVSMINNEINKSMTIKNDALVMRCIANMIGETLHDANPVRAVNLLDMYETLSGETLTPEVAIMTPEFVRFAAYQIGLTSDRLTKISSLFNVGGRARFTPKDLQHVVMLSDFRQAADIWLQSSTYHDEYTRLAAAETVPYWQGSGTGYSFTDVSSIKVTTSGGHTVTQSGIIAAIWDHEALGVTNLNSRVTTQYNAKAEFTNYFYKRDAKYFNDLNENLVVFYLA